ncbi:MAG: NADH-quinone oxidoreductase subunit J [Fimbriimonadaceae bacterium]|nr:NADH-quinone oxidoreductase subunit J [Fimbriimonadaceae bacterium]
MDSNLIIFGVMAFLSAIAAVGVVAMKSPVRSALCLVVNFFILAFIYFSLNAQLLGISQILVYTGAIMVLFLFVIMLLNLGAPQNLQEKKDIKPGIGVGLGIALFALIAFQVLLPLQSLDSVRSSDDYGLPQTIGRNLFTTYVLPFEMASVLLLVGIVGAILLAKRKI